MIARCRRRHERHADPEKTLVLETFLVHLIAAEALFVAHVAAPRSAYSDIG
jgi:hypothetical protein